MALTLLHTQPLHLLPLTINYIIKKTSIKHRSQAKKRDDLTHFCFYASTTNNRHTPHFPATTPYPLFFEKLFISIVGGGRIEAKVGHFTPHYTLGKISTIIYLVN